MNGGTHVFFLMKVPLISIVGHQWLTWQYVLINLQVSRGTSVVPHWCFRRVHTFSSVTFCFEIPLASHTKSQSYLAPFFRTHRSFSVNHPVHTISCLQSSTDFFINRSLYISRLNCSNKSDIIRMCSCSVLLASRSKYYDETGWIIIAATRRPWHWPWYRIAPNCTSSSSRSLTVHVYRTSTQSFHSTNQTELAIFRPSDRSFIIYPCNANLLRFYHVLNTETQELGSDELVMYTRGYSCSAHFHHTPSGEWNTKHCIPYFPSVVRVYYLQRSWLLSSGCRYFEVNEGAT